MRKGLRATEPPLAHSCIEGSSRAEYIEQARRRFSAVTSEIEIDDEPVISVAEEGVWVSAWVWVPREVADRLKGRRRNG
jgi:hypothetical protein